MKLFEPLQLGALSLPNRIIMAPLTRCRAGEGRVPTDLMAKYYVQRATAGLIMSEATSVSAMGVGYPNTPGIWSEDQVEGWKKVTQAVHDAGGLIHLQLWHVGRISDPSYLDGELPIAPSAIAAKGHVSLVRPKKDYVVPRAISVDEIKSVVEEFRVGAENAKKAGFDGVLIHSANGYLIDEFLQDSANHRDDQYGGSIENRSRFLLEIVDAVTTVWESGRVGVHLAPRGDEHDMGDSDPLALFTHVAKELGNRSVAYISAREQHDGQAIGPEMKKAFGGPFIANQGFDQASAEKAVHEGDADAVAFGKAFIANPDLVERFRTGAALNEPDPSTFYFLGDGEIEHGYTDYPTVDADSPG
ncbi:alkene reductase [Haloferula chungangensis]|uniref:Alkene reductase n=1 Tax=Haloferula chungangensis TaxID=1048331 RepID=A0ABW2L4S2_9BACT